MTEPEPPATPLATRAGIVTVTGKPNAGKSTLLNRLVGQKLSITSAKPQSTRDRIVGIYTRDAVQMVIFDTPGLLIPTYELQTAMRRTALQALDDADVIVYVADATEGMPAQLMEAAALEHPPRAPVLLVLNKSDALKRSQRTALRLAVPEALLISSHTGDGVAELVTAIGAALPPSPYLYPEDEVSTQSMRFFVAELVRETALEQLNEEVPYSIACEVEEFREDREPVYIRAVVYTERESQKRILIGEGGTRIRDIGRASRLKVEKLVGAPVYLDLWVKVLPNWRRNMRDLRRFGYKIPGATEP
ncbi:MAG: GTPase Era [Acidobacteriota bacterium]|nr:GTPase Era [Acidobacteriota bacterium]